MLVFTEHEKKILDALLIMDTKAAALKLGVKRQEIYNVKHRLRARAQNAQEFLSVARGKYAPLLTKRIKTPRIMPIEIEGPQPRKSKADEWDDQEETEDNGEEEE
jgi:hypothetical protein